MKGHPRVLLFALALAAAAPARAGEIDIVGFSTDAGMHFQGGAVSNYFTLEFAPTLAGPWTNWGAVSSASITGSVMSLPFPFFYRIVETPDRAFPPYATGTPVYAETDSAALEALEDYSEAAASTYQPRGDYATGTPVYVEADPAAFAALADYETATHAAATFQPLGDYLSNGQPAPVSLGCVTIATNGKVGIGQTNPIAVFSVGNLSYPSFHDFMIAAARAVDDTKYGTIGHAFLDGSSVDRGGKIAYFSFESHAECIGTNDYSEIVSFRNANAYSTSGTVDTAVSFDCFPRVEKGVVKYLIGLHVHPFYKATSGTGIVERQYGVYVNPLTNATLDNYAFYSAGSTPSRFGGRISANGGITAQNTSYFEGPTFLTGSAYANGNFYVHGAQVLRESALVESVFDDGEDGWYSGLSFPLVLTNSAATFTNVAGHARLVVRTTNAAQRSSGAICVFDGTNETPFARFIPACDGSGQTNDYAWVPPGRSIRFELEPISPPVPGEPPTILSAAFYNLADPSLAGAVFSLQNQVVTGSAPVQDDQLATKGYVDVATAAPAARVVSEDYTVQPGDGAVGADTSGGDVAITLPDLDDRFASVLVRKFSPGNALVVLHGTNVLETLADDGAARTYDWWPDRADWFPRN